MLAKAAYQYDRVRIRVARSDTMGKVQRIGIKRALGVVPADDLVDRNAEERMVFRRTSIVEILGPARRNGGD